MTRLIDLCDLIVDCEHKTALTQETGYPSIRTPNIGRGRLLLEKVNRVSEDTYRAWTQRAEPQVGDLILGREAPVGNVAIITPGLKVCLGQRTVLIRVNRSKLNPQYLTYLLLGDEIQGRVASVCNGATVHHLNMKDIRELEMPSIPALDVQDRIAAILSTYDDLIENNTRRIKILEEMAQMLYREWFVHFRFPGHEKVQMVESELGPIPEGWPVVGFDVLCDVLSGGTPKTSQPEYWNGSISFFGPTDAPDAFYVLETARRITELGLRKCNSRLYPAETVFITARGTVGKVVLTSRDMAMNQSCYALRGKPGINQLALFLLTRHCAERLRKKAHGAVFDSITVETFQKLKVARPPCELLERLECLIRPHFAQSLNLLKRNSNLRTTRDLLLPKLISGEIPVEAADDTAAQLMEEIAQPA
ncbi:MAG: restriction endonuclease subunit S [Terriglobia bacterium]